MSLRDLLAVADEYLPWIPNWVWAALMLVAAAALALLLHRAAVRLMRRLVSPQQAFLQSLISATDGLIRMALVIVAVAIVLPVAPLDRDVQAAVGRVLVVAFILLVGWSASTAIVLASDFYLRRANVASADNPLARKHITQVRVLRRVTETLVIIVTVAAALMTFDSVKQYGVSLIASAGAAGIVVGLAARPLLTNLIAGIQLAITQPIRIGDAVIVENEWGWIEEITGTYVVIKVWDWRRADRAAVLFPGEAVPELDPPRYRFDRIGLAVGRLHGAGRPRPVQARGDRADDQAVERRGGQPAGGREQRTGRAVAGPGQRGARRSRPGTCAARCARS